MLLLYSDSMTSNANGGITFDGAAGNGCKSNKQVGVPPL